jgi:Uma2 family endonuclease
VLLVVEVADSSLRLDAEVKLPLYARAAVPEVWIFDLSRERLLLSSEPQRNGQYARGRELGPIDFASPEAFPDVRLGLSELFD